MCRLTDALVHRNMARRDAHRVQRAWSEGEPAHTHTHWPLGRLQGREEKTKSVQLTLKCQSYFLIIYIVDLGTLWTRKDNRWDYEEWDEEGGRMGSCIAI